MSIKSISVSGVLPVGSVNPKVGGNSAEIKKSSKAGSAVGTSLKYSELMGVISSSPVPFDAQSVASIKEAIATDTFKVNAEKVADGMLNSSMTLNNQA